MTPFLDTSVLLYSISRDPAEGFNRERANWARFRIQEMNLEVLQSALTIRKTHDFFSWDCAIIAVALVATASG